MVRKSLHLTNAWHPASGGIRTFYLALMEAANQRGHQMRMVVPSDSTRVEQVGEHCKIYHLKAPRAPINPAYRVLYPHHYLFHGGVIRRILNDERPDVIEICDKYCFPYLGGLLRVGRLPGVDFRPTVVNLSCERFTDNLSAYASSGLLARLFAQWYLRWVYFPMADHHIAVSPYIAEELQTVAEGHKVDRGVWIGPMGVDYANFAAARPDAALRACLCPDAAPNTRLLVYAGRLAKEKNLSLLLETLAELRQDAAIDYRLLIIGDGKLREWLQAESKRRTPGAVRFHGHIDSRQQLASIYANCDVFIHPNPREPFGIGPLEAMAAGLAVVAPQSGGLLSYANPGNAWLAPPNASAFADAVRDAVTDCADRQHRITAARQAARQMNWPRAAAHFIRLYETVHGQVNGQTPREGPSPLFVSTKGVF